MLSLICSFSLFNFSIFLFSLAIALIFLLTNVLVAFTVLLRFFSLFSMSFFRFCVSEDILFMFSVAFCVSLVPDLASDVPFFDIVFKSSLFSVFLLSSDNLFPSSLARSSSSVFTLFNFCSNGLRKKNGASPSIKSLSCL